MIRVGTCGYAYDDWAGAFYPPKLRPAERLAYYAERFTAVEIDSTYYRVLPATTFATMDARTPDGFRFTAKLPSTATHRGAADDDGLHPDVLAFRRSIDPLVDAGKFACALMQFPNGFHPTPAAHALIERLRETLDDIELVAEFRHRDWQTHETLALLSDLGIGWTNVDLPDYPTLLHPGADASSSIGYVRFHGRNSAMWWKGDNVTRYDYAYTEAELEPWTERVADLAASANVRETFAFFNNHRRGQATRNAEIFESMLEALLPADAVSHTVPSDTVGQQLTLDGL